MIGLAITLILLTGTPALAVGPDEWKKAVSDIAELQQNCGQNTTQIQNLTLRVQQLEQENIQLKSKVSLLDTMFAQLKDLLMKVVQMLIIVMNK